jgi:hypothetical protein
MNRLFIIVLAASFVLLSVSNLNAKTDTTPSDSTTFVQDTTGKPESHKMNLIKINLFALPLRTLTLQYERVINKFLSVTIAARYMPRATIPYKNWIYNKIGEDDPEFKESLDNMLISNYAITPEVRFYLGKKGYGRGFYLAPSYRYAHFTLANFEYTYTDDQDQENSMNMSGKMTANYGGFMMGAQWALGKHLSLDWWIFAPFLGVENTNLTGTTTLPLSEEDQNNIREDLGDIEIPYTTTTVSVHEYGVSIQMHGLMTGISTGLAFGVRF